VDFSLALTKTGRVYSWGGNEFGQLGIQKIESTIRPELIE
jgi:alpha-tubulin suppressor-like RCC1 family protein